MITREEIKTIADNGIWKQNTSIVQILGLCPLLAVTTNAVNGIMLSLATIIVMAMTIMVASDSMMPFTALVVTASNGQRPRIWTMEVFCFQMPLSAMVLISSRVIIGWLPFWQTVGCGWFRPTERP